MLHPQRIEAWSSAAIPKILGAKSATFPRPNTSWCGSVGVELRSFAPTRGRIARTRRDLAIRHRRSAASTAEQGLERFRNQNTRRKVGHFSKAEHVVVRIGGRGIAEFRSNPGQDSKISPRSSHPSPQKCCIHSEFFISRFTHLTCCDRVAPLKITEPYRWWREKPVMGTASKEERLVHD